MELTNPDRRAAVEAYPAEIQDHCIIEWRDVAAILSFHDVEYCRKVVLAAGVPTVRLSERKNCPRWGDLREYINSRREVRS
jgi:hypothetical protein